MNPFRARSAVEQMGILADKFTKQALHRLPQPSGTERAADLAIMAAALADIMTAIDGLQRDVALALAWTKSEAEHKPDTDAEVRDIQDMMAGP